MAETPPPLRSLHGEVRRLQAALDAERFDRNYLQEELARTNLRMNKLCKLHSITRPHKHCSSIVVYWHTDIVNPRTQHSIAISSLQ